MGLNLSRRNTRWVVAKLFSMMESFRFEGSREMFATTVATWFFYDSGNA